MLITRSMYYRWAPTPKRAQPEVDALFAGREGLSPLEICNASMLSVHSRLCALLRPEVLPQLELDELACAFARRALALDPDERLRDVMAIAEARCASQRSVIALSAKPGSEARLMTEQGAERALTAQLRVARIDALNRSVDSRLSDVQRCVARAVRFAATTDESGPDDPPPASSAAGNAATAYYCAAPAYDADPAYNAELAHYWDLVRRRLVALQQAATRAESDAKTSTEIDIWCMPHAIATG